MVKSDFDLDLKYGMDRENAFSDILAGATVEIKSDRMADRTGNFFLEFEQRSGPSGISVSKADFWAIEFSRNRWLILPTAELREIGETLRAQRGLVNGGDNGNLGVLVPLMRLFYPRSAKQ